MGEGGVVGSARPREALWSSIPDRAATPHPGGASATSGQGARPPFPFHHRPKGVRGETAKPTSYPLSRPGHPVLVKVSYHPRWRADGALGPYLASPGLMLVVPQQREVRLWYAARTGADSVGDGLLVGAMLAGIAAWWRRRVRAGGATVAPLAAGETGAEVESHRASRALRTAPFALLAVLPASRALPPPPPEITGEKLGERASRAYSEEDWMAAAEYARHAADHLAPAEPLWTEILCVRGNALARAGHPREAALAFGRVIAEAPDDPHRAQALYSGAKAREAAGDAAGAAEWRRWLRAEFPANPWTDRLSTD
jgi:hypothetical protein